MYLYQVLEPVLCLKNVTPVFFFASAPTPLTVSQPYFPVLFFSTNPLLHPQCREFLLYTSPTTDANILLDIYLWTARSLGRLVCERVIVYHRT